MPLPTSIQFTRFCTKAMALAGATGSITLGTVSQAPINGLHLMVEVMFNLLTPLIAQNIAMGVFVGSVGSPSASSSPPSPHPLILPAGVSVAAGFASVLGPASAQTYAAENGWLGPAATSIGLGIHKGVLDAFTSSGLSIQATPGDPAFLGLISGFLDYKRPALVSKTLIGQLTTAWSAVPDFGPANRTQLANMMLGSAVDAYSALVLTATISNPSGVPAAPGTPYPHSQPIQIL